MADFHRLTNPGADYYNPAGGPLPAGYDYVNNTPGAPGGTNPGDPALFNAGPKPAGFNSGTYFLAWRDEATSANVNRTFAALAQNTDYLDNLLRRRQALPKVVPVTTVGGETYLTLTDWVWCGDDPADDPSLLVQVLEADGTYAEASFEAIGIRFSSEVTDIKDNLGAGSVIGSGWVQNPRIYLTLSAAPQSLLVVYGVRSSLASHDAGAIYDKHHFSSIPYELEKMIWDIKGVQTGAWNSNPPSTLQKLKTRPLQHSYNAYDDDFTAPTPGAGYLIERGGKALTVRSAIGTDVWTSGGPARTYVDRINSCFAAEMRDTAFSGSNSRTNWSYGSVGFTSFASRWDIKGKREYTPSFASFISFESQFGATKPASVGGHYYLTNIPEGQAALLTPVADGAFVLELPGTGVYPDPYFWIDLGAGDLRTAVLTKKDVVECTMPGGEKRSFVIFALYAGQGQLGGVSNVRMALVYPIDAGQMSDIVGATAVNVTWHAASFAVGHGSGTSKTQYNGIVSAWGTTGFQDFGFDGVFIAGPRQKTNALAAGDDFFNVQPFQPALTVGVMGAAKALSIGQFAFAPSQAFIQEEAWIKGTGDAKFRVTEGLRFRRQYQSLSGPAYTLSMSNAQAFIITDPTPNAGFTYSVTINGLTTAEDKVTEIEVQIIRTTNTAQNWVPTVTGFTSIFDLSTMILSPVQYAGFGGTRSRDVYIGRVLGDKVFWSVTRHTD